MSADGTDGADLLAIVDRIVAQAAPGEQVEAFASRGGDTDVRVYPGGKADWVAAGLPMEHSTQAAAELHAKLPA